VAAANTEITSARSIAVIDRAPTYALIPVVRLNATAATKSLGTSPKGDGMFPIAQ